jgi:hypothetical protein
MSPENPPKPPNMPPVSDLPAPPTPAAPASKARPVGIVADTGEASPASTIGLAEFDIKFPPLTICGPAGFQNNGGQVASQQPVWLLFWGPSWHTEPLLTLSNNFTAAVKKILAGPYMSGLRQYGVKRCTFGGTLITASPPPLAPNTYGEGTVQGVIQPLIDNGTFSEPDEGVAILPFVIVPPNTIYGPGGAAGAHSFFSTGSIIDADNLGYAWVGYGPLAQMTATFSHELAEMCTDAFPQSGWAVPGAPAGCSEIGDFCNGPSKSKLVNDVFVQAYWSNYDNACLIPTAWSVRRTLAGAGKKLNGLGLTSLQKPILSMNLFLVLL